MAKACKPCALRLPLVSHAAAAHLSAARRTQLLRLLPGRFVRHSLLPAQAPSAALELYIKKALSPLFPHH